MFCDKSSLCNVHALVHERVWRLSVAISYTFLKINFQNEHNVMMITHLSRYSCGCFFILLIFNLIFLLLLICYVR